MMFDIPDGTYPAIPSGYESEFRFDGATITLTCNNCIRGFGGLDFVTVDSSTQTIRSKLLGNAVSIKRVEEVTHQLPKPVLPDIKIPLIQGDVKKELRINQECTRVSLWGVDSHYIRDLDQFETNFVLSVIKAMKDSK